MAPASSALWGFELGDDCSTELAAVPRKLKSDKDRPPGLLPGFAALALDGTAGGAEGSQVAKDDAMAQMRQRRMMAVGQAPGKNLMMTGFMLWMSGSGINIFSIMMTGMAVSGPIKSLLAIGQTFAPFKDVPGLARAKLMFVALNLVGLSFAVYKLSVLGLLPLSSGDWISLLEARKPEEMLGGL